MLYKESGVDIDKANEGLETIKDDLGENFGAFAGLFELKDVLRDYREPILVSSTDGVGTKVLLLKKYRKFRILAQDLIAMNLNDLVCLGAKPLFFLDYYSTGKLDEKAFKEFLKHLSGILKENDCKLLGGETAELPGLINNNDFDVSGFVVGVVEKSKMLGKHRVKEDDVLLALPSNGVHSNGFSLIRKLIDDGKIDIEGNVDGEKLIDLLLKPTRIYSKIISELLDKFEIHACAHITGGGIIDNLPRVLPQNLIAVVNKRSWEIPKIFRVIQNAGNISTEEMFRVFNMGIGFVIITSEKQAIEIQKYLRNKNEDSFLIGRLEVARAKEVDRVWIR